MKTPLADADLEREMLGYMFTEPKSLDSYPMPQSAWTSLAHELVADAMRWVYDSGARVTSDSVVSRLTQQERIASVGGAMAVYEVALAYTFARTAEEMHTRLIGYASMRSQREHLRLALAAVEREDAAEAAMHAGASLERSAMQHGGEVFTLSDALLGGYKRATDPRPSMLIPTGIEAIDRAITGLGAGHFGIIAADTNVGKSSFALLMAERLARQKISLGYVSLEDGRDIIEDRLLARFSGVPGSVLRAKSMSMSQHEDILRVAEASSRNSGQGHGIVVSCLPGGTEADAIREMACLVRTRGVKVGMIDYIGAIDSSKPSENARTDTKWIASKIKHAYGRLGIPGWAASQITVDRGAGKKSEPTKHDLRDCRDLAHIAELVVVLWRDEEEDDAMVYGKIVKGKYGGNGVRMQFKRGPGGSLIECDMPAAESSGYPQRHR